MHREPRVGALGHVARLNRAPATWRGGTGSSGFVSLETWHVTNEHSLPGGEEEGGAPWSASKRGRAETGAHRIVGRKREEIGRAPCRERGKKSGVAVSLKKKRGEEGVGWDRRDG